MKIKVKLEASETHNRITLDLDDLGLTQEQWVKMTNIEKEDAIQSALNDLPVEQPYWIVVSFYEQ
jgi:hypothetical protein